MLKIQGEIDFFHTGYITEGDCFNFSSLLTKTIALLLLCHCLILLEHGQNKNKCRKIDKLSNVPMFKNLPNNTVSVCSLSITLSDYLGILQMLA